MFVVVSAVVIAERAELALLALALGVAAALRQGVRLVRLHRALLRMGRMTIPGRRTGDVDGEAVLPDEDDPELAMLAALVQAEEHLVVARALGPDPEEDRELAQRVEALQIELDAFALSGEPFGDLAAAWSLELRAEECSTVAIVRRGDDLT